MQFNQPFFGAGFPNNGTFFPYNNTPYQPQCIPSPDIVGEGEVISFTLPDGSIQLYFIPTSNKWCGPFVPPANVSNYWFVKSVSNPIPHPMYCQSHYIGCGQSQPSFGGPLPRLTFGCNGNFEPLNPRCQGLQIQFHNDASSSTTDLQYFCPRLRTTNFVRQSSAAVQAARPTLNCGCQLDAVRKKDVSCRVDEKMCDCGMRNCNCSTTRDTGTNTQECSMNETTNVDENSKKKIREKKKDRVICECDYDRTQQRNSKDKKGKKNKDKKGNKKGRYGLNSKTGCSCCDSYSTGIETEMSCDCNSCKSHTKNLDFKTNKVRKGNICECYNSLPSSHTTDTSYMSIDRPCGKRQKSVQKNRPCCRDHDTSVSCVCLFPSTSEVSLKSGNMSIDEKSDTPTSNKLNNLKKTLSALFSSNNKDNISNTQKTKLNEPKSVKQKDFPEEGFSLMEKEDKKEKRSRKKKEKEQLKIDEDQVTCECRSLTEIEKDEMYGKKSMESNKQYEKKKKISRKKKEKEQLKIDKDQVTCECFPLMETNNASYEIDGEMSTEGNEQDETDKIRTFSRTGAKVVDQKRSASVNDQCCRKPSASVNDHCCRILMSTEGNKQYETDEIRTFSTTGANVVDQNLSASVNDQCCRKEERNVISEEKRFISVLGEICECSTPENIDVAGSVLEFFSYPETSTTSKKENPRMSSRKFGFGKSLYEM